MAHKSLKLHHHSDHSREELFEETLTTHAQLKHNIEKSLANLSIHPKDCRLANPSIVLGDTTTSKSMHDLSQTANGRQLTTLQDVFTELQSQSQLLFKAVAELQPEDELHMPNILTSVLPKIDELKSSDLDAAMHDQLV